MKRAFTLIELLVVITIVIVMLAIAVPAVKSITRSSAQSQAVNAIQAYLSTARSVAISQHRQAGVVFFEESDTYSYPANPGQTAMQVIVESIDQSAAAGYDMTIFTYYNDERQYLPAGIQLATLDGFNDAQTFRTGNMTRKNRIVMFDSNGQLLNREKIAHPDVPYSSPQRGRYPTAFGDWGAASVSKGADWSVANIKIIPSMAAVSSPAIVVFNMKEYAEAAPPNDVARDAWMKRNATVLVVNAYTGNIIQ
jgi:prepilin-type N-terminal cleavage/methylation domain-containing protein